MFKWLHNLYASAFGYPCIVCGKFWLKRKLITNKWAKVITVTGDGRIGVCCWACRHELVKILNSVIDEKGSEDVD